MPITGTRQQQASAKTRHEQGKPHARGHCKDCQQIAGQREPRWVTVWELTREYGGPEEGGWWYDAGEVILTRELDREETEDAVRASLADEFPEGNGHRFSVRPRGRDYRIEFDTQKGVDFPAERPHYE